MKKEDDYDFYSNTSWRNERDFDVLTGQVIKSVTNNTDEIIFETESGFKYKMYHYQDCCESVQIESIVGDLDDLIGQKIELAEERSNVDLPPIDEDDAEYVSFTWTFYTIRTVKTSIDIRWYGSSNGFYSESVDFERIA